LQLLRNNEISSHKVSAKMVINTIGINGITAYEEAVMKDAGM
jgi:hypothetical protein